MVIERKILLAGLVRNTSNYLPKIFQHIEDIAEKCRNWAYLIIESDSTDNTLDHCLAFHGRFPNGIVRSYGDLGSLSGQRTCRLAYLRNELVRLVLSEPLYAGAELLIQMDMDDVNLGLNVHRVHEILVETPRDWAAIFANQSQLYYDIWALRHPTWSPDDCWEQVRKRPFWMSKRKARRKFVEDRQIHIPKSCGRIEVQSAFGGFGIYDVNCLVPGAYVGVKGRREICEHESFHNAISTKYGKKIVYRSRVNQWTGHTSPRL